MLPVAAVAVLFFASFFGGIEGLKTGHHLSIETIAELYNMFLVSYQNFVGGLVALIVWFIILHRNVTPYNGFNRTPESSGPAKPGESGGGAG